MCLFGYSVDTLFVRECDLPKLVLLSGIGRQDRTVASSLAVIMLIRDILNLTDRPVVGYISPARPCYSEEDLQVTTFIVVDGNDGVVLNGLDCLGGLSRFNEMLAEYDVDTSVLAFA